MTVLLIAEHANGVLSSETAKALTAALALNSETHVLVAGENCDAVAAQATTLTGVAKVLVADARHYADQLAEPMAELIITLADGYDTLVAPATTSGKNVMPRVAALLDVMQVSDIISVEGPDTFKRPIYAGNAIQAVKATDAKKVITVRTAGFAETGNDGNAALESINAAEDPNLSMFVEDKLSVSDRPDLSSAKVVVSGGRGVGSEENFAMIERLADKLGAAVGASRAAVDSGFASNECQVGQTGKVVAPDLYIAAGISGAIQHLAGMKDSKVIVAINKDDEAPIFQVADYGLVADIFEAIPELEGML